MSEGERKYTGFAAIYKLEQEKLKRESPQATPQASPPVEASEESPDSAVLEESSSAKSNSDNQLSTSNTTSVEESGADAHPVTPPALITNLRPAGPKSGRRTKRPALAKVSTATPAASGTVDYYVQKWKQIYRLNKGELKVMKVMFDLSHGAGVSECYIKVPEVAASAQLKKRRCQYVIRSLEDLGFLDRLEEYDPTNRLGTKYQVNLKPRILDIE